MRVEFFGNKGYGIAVVSVAAEWCFENSLRPIYQVAADNTPSVKQAGRVGFKTVSEDIIVSSYSGTGIQGLTL